MNQDRLLLPMIFLTFVFMGFGCSSLNAASPPVINTAIATVTSTPLHSAKTPIPSTTSWTPLPTLSPNKAQDLVAKLLKENAGCRLPCWWGIVPGQTSWQEAQASLFPIADSIYEATDENSNPRHFEVFFPAPYPSTGKFRQELLVENGIVKQVEVLPQQFSKYSVPNGLFQEFGNPEMIFLGGSVDQVQTFELILYYPHQGIFALYSNELHPFQQQEVLNVCFTEAEMSYVDIFLWNPADSFSETLDYIFGEYERPFHNIEVVTNLTVDEFSNLFESGKPGCFKTPSNFWTN